MRPGGSTFFTSTVLVDDFGILKQASLLSEYHDLCRRMQVYIHSAIVSNSEKLQ